jgi:two-component system phosphate regulon sensor histidine kinase PhoR
VDDGIAVVDASGRMQMVNPAASRLLDARSAEGKTVIEATLSHQISGLVNRVLRTGDPESLEVRLQTSDRAQADLYAAPLESPDGSLGALIVVHDLSAARRIDSVRRDFVANVSHELRTPLASIRAMAETIVLRGRGDEVIAGDFAGKIIAEADRLTAISEDLLDLAQIESGRRAVRRDEFRISELIDQVMQQLRPPAEQRSDALSADAPEDLIFHGDREALREILANLVDNAVRHTPPGTKVTVSAGLESDRMSIAVADTGEGIAAAELPRIFERFYRVDKARSRESGGTGLGLSIVKHLCELMGGTVSVRSEIGEGTTFTVSLPLDA